MKYKLRYQKSIPKSSGKLQEDVINKFVVLQKEALGIMINKNNHFKSEFLENGISLIKKMIGHKLRDIENGGKIINGKNSETLTECFIDLSNYGIMGAMLTLYDFKIEIKKKCNPRCSYEIEAREGRTIKLRCKNCNDLLIVNEIIATDK